MLFTTASQTDQQLRASQSPWPSVVLADLPGMPWTAVVVAELTSVGLVSLGLRLALHDSRDA